MTEKRTKGSAEEETVSAHYALLLGIVTGHFKTSQCRSVQNQPPWRRVGDRSWRLEDKLGAKRGRICPGVKSERSEADAPPRRGLVARLTPGGLAGRAWCRG